MKRVILVKDKSTGDEKIYSSMVKVANALDLNIYNLHYNITRKGLPYEIKNLIITRKDLL